MLRRFRVIAPFLSALVSLPSAARADHAGPSGGAAAGGAINTVSAWTLDEGHWAFGGRLSMTTPDQLSDAELLAREAAGIDSHSTRDVINASVGAAYGVTHDLILSVELPYVRRVSIRTAADGGVVNRGTSAGIGDATLLAKYRVRHGDIWAVAVLGGIKAPTGSTNLRDRNGERFETEHQVGTGSWDPVGGLAASLSSGRESFDASLMFQLATPGAQDTRLGSRAQAGVALSHRFGGMRVEDEHEHDAHHHEDAKQRAEIWDRWQRGGSMSSIGRGFERDSSSIFSVLSPSGGIRPADRKLISASPRKCRRLS